MCVLKFCPNFVPILSLNKTNLSVIEETINSQGESVVLQLDTSDYITPQRLFFFKLYFKCSLTYKHSGQIIRRVSLFVSISLKAHITITRKPHTSVTVTLPATRFSYVSFVSSSHYAEFIITCL